MRIFTSSVLLCMSLVQISFADAVSKKPEIAAISKVTPEQALQRLVEGNERYSKDKLLHADSSAERRAAISSRQEPFAVILGCSDSRVPPEIIFDQGVGDLFVVRVAGNVVGPIEIDSMEYAVHNLHSSVIMVLGHENCGAVAAALNGDLAEVNQIGVLLKPVVSECKNVNQCVKANVKYVMNKVKESSLIAPYIAKGEVEVVGAYYDLNTGKVELLK